IRRCEEILERTRGNSLVQANCHIRLAGLEGMRGRFSEARARVAQARAILTEFGLTYFLAHSRDVAALVETLAGNPVGAEAELRASYEDCERWARRHSSRKTRRSSPKRCTRRGGTTKRIDWPRPARRQVPVAGRRLTGVLCVRSSSLGEVTPRRPRRLPASRSRSGPSATSSFGTATR